MNNQKNTKKLTFLDVENARREYSAISKAYSRKFYGLTAIATIIFLAIELPIILSGLPLEITYSNEWEFRWGETIMMIPIFPFVIAVIGIAQYCSRKYNKADAYRFYKHTYKEYFISYQLSAVFTDLEYQHNKGIPQELLESTGLIHTGDMNLYNSNDFTKGKYKNVDFMQADVTMAEEYTDLDGDDHIKIFFVGRYLIFTFPKKFNFKIAIIPREAENQYRKNFKFKRQITSKKTKSGQILKKSFPIKTGINFKQVETESIDFNQEFIVYTEDDFEAFYILNPAFMESLQKFESEHNHEVYFCFSDNKMFVGINDGNDFFEPPMDANAPLDEQRELSKVHNEITQITKIVDNFKLEK